MKKIKYTQNISQSQGKISAKCDLIFISEHQVGNCKVPCLNKMSYVKIYFILKQDEHETSFQQGNRVYKFWSKQETCASSFYVFTLPFFIF